MICYPLGTSKLQYEFGTLRPSAFFSESTWYGEHAFFGLLVATFLLLNNISSRVRFTLKIFAAILALAVFLSFTRNAWLCLCLSFVVLALMNVKWATIAFHQVKRASIYVGVLLVPLFFFKIDKVLDTLMSLTSFFGKLSGKDASATGRIDAIGKSLDILSGLNFWFGTGFEWEYATVSGSAIGAKAFNILLMFFHQGGVIAFMTVLLLFLHLFLEQIRIGFQENNSLAVLSFLFAGSFFVMAQFAPMHMYSMGIPVMGISLGTLAVCKKEKLVLNSSKCDLL